MAKIKLGLKADANSACQEALLIGDYPYITSAKWWVGGDGQMLMITDKVGRWGWPNANVSKKKIQRKKKLHFTISLTKTLMELLI